MLIIYPETSFYTKLINGQTDSDISVLFSWWIAMEPTQVTADDHDRSYKIYNMYKVRTKSNLVVKRT